MKDIRLDSASYFDFAQHPCGMTKKPNVILTNGRSPNPENEISQSSLYTSFRTETEHREVEREKSKELEY
ncbi:hypothetical protein FGF1_14930 [Flavobacteriaceae bacterium GF1]